jgi:hypothetical protein
MTVTATWADGDAIEEDTFCSITDTANGYSVEIPVARGSVQHAATTPRDAELRIAPAAGTSYRVIWDGGVMVVACDSKGATTPTVVRYDDGCVVTPVPGAAVRVSALAASDDGGHLVIFDQVHASWGSFRAEYHGRWVVDIRRGHKAASCDGPDGIGRMMCALDRYRVGHFAGTMLWGYGVRVSPDLFEVGIFERNTLANGIFVHRDSHRVTVTHRCDITAIETQARIQQAPHGRNLRSSSSSSSSMVGCIAILDSQGRVRGQPSYFDNLLPFVEALTTLTQGDKVGILTCPSQHWS